MKVILRIDDTNPDDKSSMMLWCIDFGEFGIALVAGLDREEKSHVTAYADRHGDHSVQHVAYQVGDLAKFRETMFGGDAEKGKKLFFERAEVSCLRCHKVNGTGGGVGPDLTGIGKKQTREYLLESIVDPNKQIAKGFETVVLTLTNGQVKSGILRFDNGKEVHLMNPDGQLIVVPTSRIEERSRGKSAMPEDVIKKLSRSELRDLVEYLAGL